MPVRKGRKRGRSELGKSTRVAQDSIAASRREFDIDSDEIDSGDEVQGNDDDGEATAEAEVRVGNDEKRVRQARDFLRSLGVKDDELSDDADEAEDDEGDDESQDGQEGAAVGGGGKANVTTQLRAQVLERRGLAATAVADKWAAAVATGSVQTTVRKGHRLPPTCVALSPDGSWAVTGGKDCRLVRWDFAAPAPAAAPAPQPQMGPRRIWSGRPASKADMRRALRGKAGGNTAVEATAAAGVGMGIRKPMSSAARAFTRRFASGLDESTGGHWAEVLAVAVSTDGTVVASAGRDWAVRVWAAASGECMRVFRGHKDAVTGLSFLPNSMQLLSCSMDRSLRLWGVKEGALIDSFFGHTTGSQAVVAVSEARAATAGGCERAMRVWKLQEESQLVFKAPKTVESVDCIAAASQQHFVTGSQNGLLALWHVARAKPVVTAAEAHGPRNWITSVACPPSTRSAADLVVSGSCDGQVRLWRLRAAASPKDCALKSLCSIAVPGFANGLAISPDGRRMLVAAGQEHRLGRWWRQPEAQNGLVVLQLADAGASDDEEGEDDDEEEAAGSGDE